jgi:riboflavin synthase
LFTGIVEGVGVVERIERGAAIAHLSIREERLAREVAVGDSVAVNGCCLTVTAARDGALHVDAVPETLERTDLGDLAPGDRVNLERALRADGRLDGHIVQGHVDETGRIRELLRRGEDVRLVVETSEAFSGLLVEKGSVAIDGVSLTVVGVGRAAFDVALIPHTLGATTLGELQAGRRVNLEADILGKYVKRFLERIAPGAVPGH